jgi:hypothetical protein
VIRGYSTLNYEKNVDKEIKASVKGLSFLKTHEVRWVIYIAEGAVC